MKNVTYFQDKATAQSVADSLPAFTPSRFLGYAEIQSGLGSAVVREFRNGFAVQLGAFGNYFPATTADSPPDPEDSVWTIQQNPGIDWNAPWRLGLSQ